MLARHSLMALLGSALCFAAALAGCASGKTVTAPSPPPPPPVASDMPHEITNLSQLSTQDTAIRAFSDERRAFSATPVTTPALSMGSHAPGDETPATLRRLFLNHPESARYTETELPHAEERLLNAKAAEYPGFSNQMLSQLLKAMVAMEGKPPIVTLPLSDDLRPVALTAVLSDQGQLQELIFERHSGIAAVDKLVVDACKASLQANNMPKGALAKDGNYRLRIEAKLSHYSTDRNGNQTFITRLGLGIL
jgi:hypothetical protein